jgi:hypothetical protein
MLTEEQKEHIKLEEFYRREIQAALFNIPKGFKESLITFLNSAFGLWLLSAVILAGGVKLYKNQQEASEHTKMANQVLERLDLEISYRYARFLVGLYALSDHTDSARLSPKYTADDVRKVALNLKSSGNPNGEYFYPEYSKFGLLGLLAEEKRVLSQLNKKDELFDKVIRDLTGLEVFYEVNKADFGSVRSVAIIVEQRLLLKKWKDNDFYFFDGHDLDPFL